MKKILWLLVVFLTVVGCRACASDHESELPESGNGNGVIAGSYFGGKKVLVAYFSWGGTTRRMAEEIRRITDGDLFEIRPATPYPTEYTPCTEVAREERDNDDRPEIKTTVENWADYDVVFVGCPVWWHTAPMIISTFAESYDFAGKTVVPFCTYASTYRDETLQKIVDLTPDAAHLTGLGTTGSTGGVQTWIDRIDEQWDNLTPENPDGEAAQRSGASDSTPF